MPGAKVLEACSFRVPDDGTFLTTRIADRELGSRVPGPDGNYQLSATGSDRESEGAAVAPPRRGSACPADPEERDRPSPSMGCHVPGCRTAMDVGRGQPSSSRSGFRRAGTHLPIDKSPDGWLVLIVRPARERRRSCAVVGLPAQFSGLSALGKKDNGVTSKDGVTRYSRSPGPVSWVVGHRPVADSGASQATGRLSERLWIVRCTRTGVLARPRGPAMCTALAHGGIADLMTR